jgi:hypothetical protein
LEEGSRLPKIDPLELMEICECCLFDGEPQICSQCGMFRTQRGRNYFVPKNRTIMAALEIVERVNRERRQDV